MRIEGTPPEVFTSNPDQFGQYMLVVYRDGHGITRTVAWRQTPADTWSPEHLLFAAEAAS